LGEAFVKKGACELVNIGSIGPILPDNVITTNSCLIISVRLKEFLISRKTIDVEYLPMSLVDEKERKIPGQLILVHPVNDPDCLDIAKSKPTYNIIKETEIEKLQHIVFHSDPRRDLFRINNFHCQTFVSRSLAEAIHKAGFTGVQFWEVKGYVENQPRIAYEGHVTVASSPSAPAATSKKRSYAKPPNACEDWIDTIVKQFKQSKSGASNFEFEGQSFVPQWGDDEWLDSYDEENSPAFDPKRYHAIGFNGESDYWLLDLADSSVVYYSHENGYDETNCQPVAKDWVAFSRKVSKRK